MPRITLKGVGIHGPTAQDGPLLAFVFPSGCLPMDTSPILENTRVRYQQRVSPISPISNLVVEVAPVCSKLFY